eukprot:5406012-Pyramimonas_sp.AAC.1
MAKRRLISVAAAIAADSRSIRGAPAAGVTPLSEWGCPAGASACCHPAGPRDDGLPAALELSLMALGIPHGG